MSPNMQSLQGKIINNIIVTDDSVWVHFTNGDNLQLSDAGQCCCEVRYLHVDETEDLSYFKGAAFVDATVGRFSGFEFRGCDSHEICFLDIKTSKGVLSVSAHNEHNGYYGGFYIVANVNGDKSSKLGYSEEN